jgi:hypothetical protein
MGSARGGSNPPLFTNFCSCYVVPRTKEVSICFEQLWTGLNDDEQR